MIYITGDIHGDVRRVEQFCYETQTMNDDILIMLGDVGVNFDSDIGDQMKKELLSMMPIRLFCIHGNHEQRPSNIPTYHEAIWNGGIVYVEDEFPNILFTKDGEIFDIDGAKTVVIGGAYSIDKYMRLAHGYGWWPDEQPSEEIKDYVEQQLENEKWNVDIVLSHTVPFKYEPVEVFLKGIDQSTVDKTTERWLDDIENKLSYAKWYAGHYHTEKKIDKLELMYKSIHKFNES